MELKTPYFLFLLPLLGFLFYWWSRQVKESSFQFPSANIVKGIPGGWKVRFYRIPYYLRWVALGLLVFALCGPRKMLEETMVTSEGIDIVLSVDISGSMAAEDYMVHGQRVNRLETIKEVVKEFINNRTNDRIGLVVFGSQAYTVCPLTTDYKWLKENLSRVRLGVVEDATAIGLGLAQGLLRLKDSQAKSKIIILLTDGANNAGRINPLTAGKMAQTMGVKVYTVGAGSNGTAPVPVDMFGQTVYRNIPVTLEEGPLKDIARLTGGKYFRASDTQSLSQVYKEIDALEKTKIQTKGYRQYQELFWVFILMALGIIALEILLANTLLLKLP
jgi:Ca-activated chloride channel homolog